MLAQLSLASGTPSPSESGCALSISGQPSSSWKPLKVSGKVMQESTSSNIPSESESFFRIGIESFSV